MKQLTGVSETALITLRSRAIESRKSNPVLLDPVGEECLEALVSVMPDGLRKRVMERKLSPVLTRHIALRARQYDRLCMEFLEESPDGLVVSLGSGFDTRFWRLGESWISKVKEMQTERVLFVAEGLFMYLPSDQVVQTLIRLAESFHSSRLVMEVVAEKYTRGFRKKMVERKMRSGAGSTAGGYYQYGIKEARDLESYHSGFRVKGEWSFFEDPDIQPAFLKVFRHFKSLSKTQYTVIADIN